MSAEVGLTFQVWCLVNILLRHRPTPHHNQYQFLIWNEGVEVELQMTDELHRFKPLPWENTDSTTFAHALQCSFCLFHLIVDCVETLFNMIKLFCNVKAQFCIWYQTRFTQTYCRRTKLFLSLYFVKLKQIHSFLRNYEQKHVSLQF